MSEPTIACPECGTEIPLTASLAAPLVAAERKAFEAQLAAKESELEQRIAAERDKLARQAAEEAKASFGSELDAKQDEIAALQENLKQRENKVAELQKGQAKLAKERQDLEDQKAEMETTIAEKLRGEREKIATEAERKARIALQDDFEAKAKETAELQEAMAAQRAKLQEAQAAQAELLKKQRELEDARAQLELDVQKRVQTELDAARAQARKEADEAAGLRLAESQHTIESMKKQIEDLKRRAEQGSQQLQGEVQELELESQLGAQFPLDTIAPVPKGEFGGDTVQTVNGPLGQPCGTILWESKRTKAWSDGWLPKLRDDQRAAQAEVAVIVSQALPKEVDTFALIDGVWVTSPRCALPVAVCLRQSLIEIALTRQTQHGQESKMEMLYEYLTGAQFRQRVEAIVEAFSTMNDDLAKEKRAIQRQWAKREKQLERVLLATAGMYGDLQGIAGQSIKEIEGLELLGGPSMLEDEDSTED